MPEGKLEKTLHVPATHDSIRLIIDETLPLLEESGEERKIVNKVRLVLEELLVNVVSYAYDGGEGYIDIHTEITFDPKNLLIVIKDGGKPFDPTAKKDPDLNVPLKDRPIGGLGIFLVKQTMDEVIYERVNDENVLTLKKKLEAIPA